MTSAVADYVVAVGANGRIISRGTIAEALERDPALRGDVAETSRVAKEEEKIIDPEEKPPKEGEKPSGQLITKEEISEGRVGWDACKSRPTPLPELV